MYEILLVIYLLAAIAVIGLVLVQHGKGADMGASFGSGASNTVFGATGSGNFLSHATAIFATVFFILSLVLGNISTNQGQSGSSFEDLALPKTEQSQHGDMTAAPIESKSSDIPTE